MNTQIIRICVVALMALVISACNQPSGQSSSGTAVIDLAAVASATGQEEAIQQKAQARREEIGVALNETAAGFEDQLNEEREKLGESPSDEQQQQFQQLAGQIQQQYGQAQQQAQQLAQQFEANLVMELRDKVKPVAAGVAQSRGVAVVFLADVTLFWFEPQADITDEVIEKLLADPSILASEPEPAAEPAPEPAPEPEQAAEPAGN